MSVRVILAISCPCLYCPPSLLHVHVVSTYTGMHGMSLHVPLSCPHVLPSCMYLMSPHVLPAGTALPPSCMYLLSLLVLPCQVPARTSLLPSCTSLLHVAHAPRNPSCPLVLPACTALPPSSCHSCPVPLYLATVVTDTLMGGRTLRN